MRNRLGTTICLFTMLSLTLLVTTGPGRSQTVKGWPPGFYELVDNNGRSIKSSVTWCIENREETYYFVTNKHGVTRNGRVSTNLYLTRPGAKQFIAVHVDGIHPTQDLVALHADRPPPFPVARLFLSKKPVSRNQRVWMWHRGGNQTFTRKSGYVIEDLTTNLGYGWVTNLSVAEGTSGSPVFDSSNDCIGVNTAVVEEKSTGRMHQFFTPIESVKELFDSTH